MQDVLYLVADTGLNYQMLHRDIRQSIFLELVLEEA
jgi:hypothetical protein